MTYFGTKDFQHKRQVGIPLVVNVIDKGQLRTLFTKSPGGNPRVIQRGAATSGRRWRLIGQNCAAYPGRRPIGRTR